MSTATKHFIRRGALPFCADEVAEPPSSLFDTIELDPDDDDGDEGFSRAMRLWWMLKTVQLVPAGSFTNGGADFSFSKSFPALLPSTTDLQAYLVRGAIIGGASSTLTSQAPVEPVFRQCEGFLRYIVALQLRYYYTGTPGSGFGDTYEIADYTFSIAYISGKWNLCYKFIIELRTDAAVIATISNPAAGSTPDDSGTFSLFDINLQWEVKLLSGTSATGVGISGTSAYWTF